MLTSMLPHQTFVGRLTIVVLMGTALLTIPKRTNKLIHLLSQQSVYVHTSFRASSGSQHIIVCGSVGEPLQGTPVFGAGSGVVPFFYEFFHEVREAWFL